MDDFRARFAKCNGEGSPQDICEYGNVREGLIVGLLSIGTAFGALFTAPIADRIGRTRAMRFVLASSPASLFRLLMLWFSLQCFVFCVGVIIQVTTFSAWYQIGSKQVSRWANHLLNRVQLVASWPGSASVASRH
jgi:SP family sugar:H+ symporter-like MFS transporter